MTCAHVLGLIDAGPFADYPAAHLRAAWQHAQQCATCGPALAAATALTDDLAALPQLTPPPDLRGTVMARIAQLDEATARAEAASDARPPSLVQDWPAWATALGTVSASAAIILWMPSDGLVGAYLAPRLGLMTISATAGTVSLAAGLVLYAVGLFAPVTTRSES